MNFSEKQKHQCLVFDGSNVVMAAMLEQVRYVLPFTTQLQRVRPPHMAAHVNCLLKVSDELVTVLGPPGSEAALGAAACVVVLDDGNKRIGLLAEEVRGIIMFSDDEVVAANDDANTFIYNETAYHFIDAQKLM